MSTIEFGQNIPERLADERRRLRLEQQEVAPVAGVHAQTYRSWEKGTAIPAHKLAMLAAAGFDVDYILTGHRLPPHIRDLVAAFRLPPGQRESRAVQHLSDLNVSSLMLRPGKDQMPLLEHVFSWAPTPDAIRAFVSAASSIRWAVDDEVAP